MCMLTLPIYFLTDIQGNTTGASVNNLFFNQPFFNPELIPSKVLPGMVYLVVKFTHSEAPFTSTFHMDKIDCEWFVTSK